MIEKAIFAGGCFWCMVKPFDKYDGVLRVISGYTGGTKENPTYREVCSGTTGHVEAVEITFENEKITFDELLAIFWRQIDPTDSGGQFEDRGTSYQTAIFYTNDNQIVTAENAKHELEASGRFSKPIVTKIRAATTFYPAEDYHQDFYKTNPERYELNEKHSSRTSFIAENWKNDNKQ